MKLAVYAPDPSESFRLGIVSDDARITPVQQRNGVYAEDVGDLLRQGPAAVEAVEQFAAAVRDGTVTAEWQDLAGVVLAPPVRRPGKILATGQNYLSHIREVQAAKGGSVESVALPRSPKIFMKASSELVGHGSSVPYPPMTRQLDYEVELVAVIGKHCYQVEASQAADYVAGYTVMNDMSMRDIQFGDAADGPLFGKNFPGAAPCGPFFVSANEFGDPAAKRLQTIVNGEVRQDSSTAEMIFSVYDLVAHCSRLGLEPGDLISTGTPGGVGIYQRDPEAKLLHRGDQLRLRVEGIGELAHAVA